MGYIKPRSNKVFSRFKFNQHIQQEGESFDQFVTELNCLLKIVDTHNLMNLVNTLEIAQAHLLSRDKLSNEVYVCNICICYKMKDSTNATEESKNFKIQAVKWSLTYIWDVIGITRPHSSALQDGKSVTNARRNTTSHPCVGLNQSS